MIRVRLGYIAADLEPRILSIVRIVVGLLYLQHGLNEFFNLFSLNPEYRTVRYLARSTFSKVV